MSFAYMPLYTGDYLRDTRHLTMAEHGAYVLCLAYCWDSKGPLPIDERRICAIVGARSVDEQESLRRVLQEFFIRMDDGWYNRRMQQEIERAESVSRARSDAGRKGYQARAKHLPSNCQASASNPNPNPILTPSPKESKSLSGKPDLAPLKADAKTILEFLNEKAGRAYRPNDANLEFIVARLREGYTPQQCKQVVAKKCREWMADERMAEYLRPATLFNRTKFNQYAGELVPVTGVPNA